MTTGNTPLTPEQGLTEDYTTPYTQAFTSEQSFAPAQESAQVPTSHGYGQFGNTTEQTVRFNGGYGTVIPLRPMNVGETLDAAFRLLKFNPVAYFVFPLIVFLAIGVIETIASIGSGEITASGQLESFLNILGTIATPSAIISFVLTLFAGFAIQIVGTRITISSVRGKKISLKESFALLKPRLGRLIWRLFLFDLIIWAIFAVIIAGFVALVFALQPDSDPYTGTPHSLNVVKVIVLIVIIMTAAIAMALLYLRISLAPSAMVAENIGPIQGLKRSWTLTKGNFWYLLGTVLVVSIIVGFVAGTISGVFGIIVGIVFTAAEEVAGFIASMTMSVVLSITVTPLQCVLLNLLYVNMRFKRENFHLNLIAEHTEASVS